MKQAKRKRRVCGAALLAATGLAVVAATAEAEQWDVYPTWPGTTMRDISKPGTVYEEDGRGRLVVYPTEPGMSLPSFSEPGMIIEREGRGRSVVYPTTPGTRLRDFSRPGYVIEER